MVMQEVPSHNDYEEKSDTCVEAEEENVEEGKGSSKYYVDHFLPYFDHLPTSGWHFY